MKIKYLKNIGNLEDYKHEPRIVKPEGLILKIYNMAKKVGDKKNLVKESKIFLESEINEKRIKPLVGLGFAILSKDMLNVCRWDKKIPILLKNQLYYFEERDIYKSKILDIGKAGPFCIWELGIVAHEKEVWKKYLESMKSEEDKVKYLESIIEGDL